MNHTYSFSVVIVMVIYIFFLIAICFPLLSTILSIFIVSGRVLSRAETVTDSTVQARDGKILPDGGLGVLC